MKTKKTILAALFLGGAICFCVGGIAAGIKAYTFIISRTQTQSSITTPQTTPTVSETLTHPGTSEIKSNPTESKDRIETPILLMSRSKSGEAWYSLYDDDGALIRKIKTPSSSPEIASLRENDVSPDGKHLAAVTNSSYCSYDGTGRSCSDVLYLYVLDLSTGEVQYTIPLLPAPLDLLTELRRLVVADYHEKYPNTINPETAFRADIEKWTASSWDYYLSYLGSIDWSPDGTQLAFTSQSIGAQTAIRVLDIPSGSIRSVFDQPITATSLEWSPDGKWILADEYDAGMYVFKGWIAHSVDGNQHIPVAASGIFVLWIDAHRIVHTLYEFDYKMLVFDVLTQTDEVFFDTPIDNFTVSKDRTFAAITQISESGRTDIWYCPFNGKERILLDTVTVGEDYYLSELIPISPDRVYVALEQLPSRTVDLFTIWMYSPGSGQQVIRKDISAYAISYDGAYAAFYSSENTLIVQNENGRISRLQSIKAPYQLQWHPRQETLLVETEGSLMILDMDSNRTSEINLAPELEQTFFVWL
jgi:dipeptidyl aminopeptidase/acylaminoacyl peptidase